ncbi:hypothetical protein KBC79_01450 [Candidatus Woesebacteria bacterium]|nr:hypothetical protein [Candidatus Woesebacteria bacterium]
MQEPTLNPETELDELEAVINQQLIKYMGRILGNKKCRDGSYIPQPILDCAKNLIAKVEARARDEERLSYKKSIMKMDFNDFLALQDKYRKEIKL